MKLNPCLSFAAICLLAVAGCMPQPPKKEDANATHTVEKGTIAVEVVETGSIEAERSVEIKSRVGGRIATLAVDEGDVVTAGQLIAIVDPQETELQVNQQRAQLAGATAGIERQEIEISKRKVSIQNNIARLKSRLAQLELELKAQPQLTKTAVESADVQVSLAQKSLDQLIHVTQPNTKLQVQNALADAKNNLQNALTELERRRGLLAKGYVSEREVQTAELNVQLAQTRLADAASRAQRIDEEQAIERDRAQRQLKSAQLDANRANVNTFQDKVKIEEYKRAKQDLIDAENDMRDLQSLGASKRQQEASANQLKYSLADGVRQLGETQIKSPVSGVVAKRYVQAGELVTSLGSFSSGTAIVRIDDRSKLLVKLNINEIDVARMTIGQSATITVDALSGTKFSGKVTKIAPAKAVNAAGDSVVKYQVEITLDQSDNRLMSGMSAKCSIRTVDKPNVIRIPLVFLGQDDKGSFVELALSEAELKKDPKAKGKRVDITTGIRGGTEVEVLTGLSGGEKLKKPAYKGPDRKGMMSGPGGDSE